MFSSLLGLACLVLSLQCLYISLLFSLQEIFPSPLPGTFYFPQSCPSAPCPFPVPVPALDWSGGVPTKLTTLEPSKPSPLWVPLNTTQAQVIFQCLVFAGCCWAGSLLVPYIEWVVLVQFKTCYCHNALSLLCTQFSFPTFWPEVTFVCLSWHWWQEGASNPLGNTTWQHAKHSSLSQEKRSLACYSFRESESLIKFLIICSRLQKNYNL